MNILIPTDCATSSQNVIQYAMAYFGTARATFHLLYNGAQEGMAKNGLPWHKNAKHTFNFLNEDAGLVEALRENVVELNIDYIVMGAKMEAGKTGATMADVITKVKCPVLVVPQHAQFNEIKNIAFLTDYHCIYKNKILNALFETVKFQEAALRIVHVKTESSLLSNLQLDNKSFLQDYLKETEHSFHYLENKNLESEFEIFVKTHNIGLIAICAKNLNFIQRLLFEPFVNFAGPQQMVPFLVLHE